MWVLAIGLTLIFMVYALFMFAVSRRRERMPTCGRDDLFFVFLVPCLNEELVIASSIERLLALPGDNFAILVIDDGSTDRTGEVVESYDPERVWLRRRSLPDAQRGKGAALNDAYNYLRTSDVLHGRSHEHTIIAVVDADGRVEPDVLFEVAPFFSQADVGAVQIGVRMYNASDGLLARLQDFEFVSFTEVFQRGRHRVGSSGLGGNGQFNRLAALEALGDEPWTDCLAEDLDLGIRLLASGWRNAYCSTTWVNQQAVTTVRRLIRQRGRWFQGHLQCWRRLGMVLRAPVRLPARTDLIHNLIGPSLVLLMSMSCVLFVATLTVIAVVTPATLVGAFTANYGRALIVWYLLSFGLVLPYAYSYWLHEPSVGFGKAVVLGHVYVLYSFMWFVAGWLAVTKLLKRSKGWAKTERTAEPALAAGA